MKHVKFVALAFFLLFSVATYGTPALAGHAGIWKASDNSNNFYIQTYAEQAGTSSIAVIATPDLVTFEVFLGVITNGVPVLNDDAVTGTSLILEFASSSAGKATISRGGQTTEHQIGKVFDANCRMLAPSGFLNENSFNPFVGGGQSGIWKASDFSNNFYIQTYAEQGGVESVAVIATPDLISFQVFLGEFVAGALALNPDAKTGATLTLSFSSLSAGTAILTVGGQTTSYQINKVFDGDCRTLDSGGGGSKDGWSIGGVSLTYSTMYQPAELVEVEAGAGFVSFSAKPDWYISFPADPNDVPLDSCTVVSWSINDPQFEPPLGLDAGAQIDINGGPAGPIQLKRMVVEGFITYDTEFDLTTNHYAQGTSYSFVGSGGPDVSAFNVSLTAPAPIVLIQPALNTETIINKSQNYTVRWTGLSSGEIFVSLYATHIDLSSLNITNYECLCRFNDDGEGVIPSSALQQMPEPSLPGLPGLNASFDIQRVSYTNISVNGLTQGAAFGVVTEVSGSVFLQ